MKSYEKINKIRESLYLNLKTEKEIEDRLINAVPIIHSQITEDFRLLFGKELKLKDFQIYVNDPTYRQSATGLILNESLSNNEDFKLRFECLIDNGRIWVKIKDGKEISGLTDIVRKIEKAKTSEGHTELKDIKLATKMPIPNKGFFAKLKDWFS